MKSKMTILAETNSSKLATFLTAHPNIQTIITQWIDICGIPRSRISSTQRFTELVKSGGGFNGSVLDCFSTATGGIIDELLLKNFCDERSRIVPDVSSLRIGYPGCENSAVVFGENEGGRLEGDARVNLRRVVEEAALKKFAFTVGFELEFVLLEKDSEDLALAPGVKGTAAGSPAYRSSVWPVIDEIVTALANAGILVEQVIKEHGASQWEVALPALSPVESVDVYVYAREAICNIAYKHGLAASFYPTPYIGEEGPKSGEHIHVSAIYDGDDGRSSDSSWNPDEMMAGILSHLPALTAIGLAQTDSYARLGTAKIAAGGFVGWGDYNRDMPVRRIHKNHWEVRLNDCTSNAYAMVAGIMSAAMDKKTLDIGNATSKSSPLLFLRPRLLL